MEQKPTHKKDFERTKIGLCEKRWMKNETNHMSRTTHTNTDTQTNMTIFVSSCDACRLFLKIFRRLWNIASLCKGVAIHLGVKMKNRQRGPHTSRMRQETSVGTNFCLPKETITLIERACVV